MKRLTESNWIKAIAINIVMITAIMLCSELVYETNDDYAIAMRIVDGYPYITFINYYLMRVLIGVQGLLHGINAFAVFQIGAAFVCFTLITWILLDSKKNGWFMVVSVIILSIYAMDQYCILQFTKSSALMLVTGTLVLIDAFIQKRGPGFYIAAFILMYAGFCLRFMNLYVAMGFAGVFLVCWGISKGRLLKDEGYLTAKGIGIVLLSLLIICGTFGIYKASMNENSSTDELASYVEFDYYRQYVTDYPIYESYEENRDEFDDMGIDENDLYLMDNWYLDYDGAASTENLKAIYENIYRGSDMSAHSTAKAVRSFAGAVADDIRGLSRSGIHIIILMLLAVFCLIAYRPRYWLFVIAAGAMAVAVYVYLYYLGRPAYRASYIADLAATLWLLYYMKSDYLRECFKGSSHAGGSSDTAGFRKLCIAGAVVISLVVMACFVPVSGTAQNMKASAENSRMSEKMAEFLQKNEDSFFVFGQGQRGTTEYYSDPIHVPEKGYQKNVLGFGSWGSRSPYLLDKMKKYGISNTYGDIINNDSVYVFEEKNLERLLEYLNKWYGNGGSTDESGSIEAVHAGTVDGHDMWLFKKD